MHDDLLPGWGLRPIELIDQSTFHRHLSTLRRPLSDYTFSQVFTWRNSLHLLWRLIDDHLCVFANGSGDLTLLLPPLGEGSDKQRSLAKAFELMDDYNARRNVSDRSRIEYVSEEMLPLLGQGMVVEPMGHDYVYDTQRMIDLAGGDLKSKRQERGRFMRDFAYRTEPYEATRHLEDSLLLLAKWKSRQDENHSGEQNLNAVKRQKETLATELSLRYSTELGLSGMVVYVNEQLAAFTFGEPLGDDQASVVVEKTDPSIKGLPQFIFSEFCRSAWSHRPRINAGDDWGLENLAWTKSSYRPIEKLAKFVVRKQAAAQVISGFDGITIRPATLGDIDAVEQLEIASFDKYRLDRRHLLALQKSPRAFFIVAESQGSLVGEGVALFRQTRNGMSARLYSLAVDDRQRGRGIGKRLMSAMLAECKSRGAEQASLQVEQSNASAIRLYEKLGFTATESLTDYYGEGRPGLQMVCDLTPRAMRHSTLKPAA